MYIGGLLIIKSLLNATTFISDNERVVNLVFKYFTDFKVDTRKIKQLHLKKKKN